jgi:hypothetical protein
MALGILEDEGIPGAVLADDVGRTYAGIGEARIVVPPSHEERARAVLAELREDAEEE